MDADVTVTLRAAAARDLLKRDGDTIPAWAARAGISRDYLYKLLSGDRQCSFSLLVKLAAALRVEPTTIADIKASVAA